MKSSNRLTRRIALSMAAGILVGYACHSFLSPEATKALAGYLAVVTDCFLRLIKMIIAPLVFATLVSGIAAMDDSKAIGRIGAKAIGWFVVASLLSLSVGLIFVNLTRPGVGLNLPLPAADASSGLKAVGFNLKDFAASIVPKSAIEAMSNNAILQIVVFAAFFGVALGKLRGSAGATLRYGIDELMKVMLHVTNAVMLLAPLGIFAALASTVSVNGLAVLVTYGKFIGFFYIALFALWLILYGAARVVLKHRALPLIRVIREPLMIAFSTASSEAAYPKLIESLQSFGIRQRMVGFVLPLGYSFNLDGSMIFQAFSAVFIAQAFGIDMPLGQQVTMMLVLMISSKGMAAVPRGSLVVVAAILPMFGLPESGMLLIMAIDQFLDMGRTATNILGNSVATAVIAKWEGDLLPEGQVLIPSDTAADLSPPPVATGPAYHATQHS